MGIHLKPSRNLTANGGIAIKNAGRAQQTPLQVISEILGHATMASTMIYAKVDVETLRGAALNTEEVDHGN